VVSEWTISDGVRGEKESWSSSVCRTKRGDPYFRGGRAVRGRMRKQRAKRQNGWCSDDSLWKSVSPLPVYGGRSDKKLKTSVW